MVYSGRKNPVWVIPRPTDNVKASKFDTLVTLLMKLVSMIMVVLPRRKEPQLCCM